MELYLAADDMLNTTSTNPYISIVLDLLIDNSHKFPIIPMESFYIEYSQNFATFLSRFHSTQLVMVYNKVNNTCW